jgi:hypothetical protein
MTTELESRQLGLVDYLITVFTHATVAREIELIADHLGEAGDPRAIRPLLSRLGDCQVQEDSDVEDAVCRALVSLGVMRCSGNLSFSLRPRNDVSDDVAETIRELAALIPWRYFGTPGI